MVVVLRDEKGEVEKTHWGLEAGMKRRADPIGLVGRLEFYSTHSQIMHSSHPERLEIP